MLDNSGSNNKNNDFVLWFVCHDEQPDNSSSSSNIWFTGTFYWDCFHILLTCVGLISQWVFFMRAALLYVISLSPPVSKIPVPHSNFLYSFLCFPSVPGHTENLHVSFLQSVLRLVYCAFLCPPCIAYETPISSFTAIAFLYQRSKHWKTFIVWTQKNKTKIERIGGQFCDS